MVVSGGSDDAGRLVKHIIIQTLIDDALAHTGNMVARCIYLKIWFSDKRVIDRYLTFFDQVLDLASRA